jgi:general secretion pathway protein D
MIASNRLRGLAIVAAALLLQPANSLDAHTRQGDKYAKLAIQAEARKDYDKAFELFDRAVHEDPQDAGYQMGSRRTHFEASQVHVEAGLKLKKSGELEKALMEFQKAFTTDPSSSIAVQEIKETTGMLDEQRKHPGEVVLTPVEKARKESITMIESLLPVPELKPVTNKISQLKMNNQPPKVLYETVGKLAGINVLFDPSYQAGKNANLDLTDVTLSEGLDYIALLTKTYWKPVGPNAIFVTDDNVTKRRDYEDEVVKVFYLRNPTTVQEFQEIITSVRSVTDVRRMFTYNAQNAVMVRDTVDKVALVEKLLRDMDKPKAEVVVDMIVMEVDSDRSRTIAAGLVSNGTTGLAIPIAFSPTNPVLQNTGTTGTSTTGTAGTGTSNTGTGSITTTPTTGTTGTTTTGSSFVSLGNIGQAFNFNNFSTSLPGAMLQAVMSDTSTKVMQSPEVRVSDGQKAELKIGDRIPYASGSFQPGIGTVGVSPLVSTQFQFADTGVNMTITPHVHGSDEVTLDITTDISNVSSNVTIGGLTQPVISQRKTDSHIRVRDGEVTLLGGLMQTQDSNTTTGIPGLVNIPILGKYLFGSNAKDKSKSELLVAIIPHIVRKPDIDGLDLRGIAAGQDQELKLRRAAVTEEVAAVAPAATTPATSATTSATTSSGTQAATTPAAPPAAAPAVTAPAPTAPVAAAPTTTTPTAATSGPGLALSPGTVQAKLSGPVVVTLDAANVTDLAVVPIKLRWDPKILRLNQATPAALLTKDGNVNPPTLDIRNDSGEATIELTRVPGVAGVTGSGPLIQLTFTAVGKGSTSIAVTEVNLRNSKKEAITATAPSAVVNVQ